MTHYLAMTAQPWAQSAVFQAMALRGSRIIGETWHFVTDPDALEWVLNGPDPIDVAFSLHWHWRIHEAHLARCTFIGFHASALPAFRGGAPIDNQMKRGVWDSQLTAFRLTPTLDGGPILLQEPISLRGSGPPTGWRWTAKPEILERIAALVPGMLCRILDREYTERPQVGAGSFYTRRDAE